PPWLRRVSLSHAYVELSLSSDHWYLHSFPTRRSSDLQRRNSNNETVVPAHRTPCRGPRRLRSESQHRPTRLLIVDHQGRGHQAGDRKSTRLNASHVKSRMPSSA